MPSKLKKRKKGKTWRFHHPKINCEPNEVCCVVSPRCQAALRRGYGTIQCVRIAFSISVSVFTMACLAAQPCGIQRNYFICVGQNWTSQAACYGLAEMFH